MPARTEPGAEVTEEQLEFSAYALPPYSGFIGKRYNG